MEKQSAIRIHCISSNKRRLNRLDGVHLTDLGTGVFMGTTKRALKNILSE